MLPAASFAQYDVYPGTWQMEFIPEKGGAAIQLQLKIAVAEKNILYPAQLSLQCDSFSADYQLLLVKKNSRELAISKNKYTAAEQPFSLGNAMFLLNGIFDHSRDFKGNPVLTIHRLHTQHQLSVLPDTMKLHKKIAASLLEFLKNAEIRLSKQDGHPWKNSYSERILTPSQSPAYFGLLDTIHVPVRDGFMDLSSYSKNDIVSASLNGKVILEQQYLNRRAYRDDLLLDTGLNILVLFSENFSSQSVNKGKMDLEFGKKKYKLDLSRRDDSAASFIAAKLFFEQDKNKEIYFQENDAPDKPLRQNEKLLGSVVANSRQLTLAVWDDAVEDGDSISVNINGEWVAKAMAVKKNPQFITVTLKPGANTITFIGDNLGSIPPNTSILELIDGKKRKSFMLETVPGEDNLLKIFYDLRPD